MSALPLTFTASVIPGAGRGKDIGAPTLNVDLSAVPMDLEEGIFAAHVEFDGSTHMGALHHGPRPVFQALRACEVHVIGETIENPPSEATITVVQYIREIQDFPSLDDLKEQIQKDIAQCISILSA